MLRSRNRQITRPAHEGVRVRDGDIGRVHSVERYTDGELNSPLIVTNVEPLGIGVYGPRLSGRGTAAIGVPMMNRLTGGVEVQRAL